MTKNATLFNRPNTSWFELVSTYDEEFIDDLKSFVAYENRKWVPETKSWRIRVSERNFILRLLKMHEYTVLEEEIEFSPSPDANLFRMVFNLIPDEYVPGVYRALAQAVHPDHGGTNEQMRDLNLAYEERKQ